MPYIDTKLNFRLTAEKEEILKKKLGEAISVFPGKSEYWLMLRFTDECRMWFRGYRNFPVAMVDVALYGSADDAAYAEMTHIITDLFQTELGISPEHCYIKYHTTEQWGWNGENF